MREISLERRFKMDGLKIKFLVCETEALWICLTTRTLVWNNLEVVRFFVGGVITGVIQQREMIPKIMIQDDPKRVDRGDLFIKFLIATVRQVISVQNGHPALWGLDDRAMISLNDDDRRRF